jgi:hypothetical protein
MQARRASPRRQTMEGYASEPVRPTQMRGDPRADDTGSKEPTSTREATVLDERAGLDQWLRSISHELAVYDRRLAPVVRDIVSADEAKTLWELLQAIEETINEHVFNPDDSVFRRLCGEGVDAYIRDMSSELNPAMRKLAGRLRAYRRVIRRLTYDEQRGGFADADLMATERNLSAESYELTTDLRDFRTAMDNIASTLRGHSGMPR